MNSFFKLTKERYISMPCFLRTITRISILFILLIPVSFLPDGKRDADHSYLEWWWRGQGLQFFLVGVFFAATAFGLLTAAKWSRLLCATVPLCYAVGLAIHPQNVTLIRIAEIIVGECIVIWYFFFNDSVKNFYRAYSLSRE